MAAVAPDGYPSWVYHPTRPCLVVKSAAVLGALPDRGNWSAIPYPENPPTFPGGASAIGSELEALTALLHVITARWPQA